MHGIFSTLIQALSLMLVSLVAGAMFGIWRGYQIADYSPATFVEVHNGAVRNLNALLPAMAMACLALVLVLAVLSRHRVAPLSLYLLAAASIVVGGLITRLINQPINAQVMTWTASSLPSGWADIRDAWWIWHQRRLAATLAAEMLLIAAIFIDRKA
ncbi:DUF1772 domain-containing protein [Rhizobium sp. TH2]|uniref:anthrone oxygenase family protein n=1 Tax=Rhizobium sp. TH2 TaxID=2775403 RepID=UPI00215856A8|nr:anthrone oxygenase family protein [Rhizobium sp. TH2]UVC10140.1 DUF1772 domain-containing protein [Rhizobium sp. TH2]